MVEKTYDYEEDYPKICKIEGKQFCRSKRNCALVIGMGKYKSKGDKRYADYDTPAKDAYAFA